MAQQPREVSVIAAMLYIAAASLYFLIGLGMLWLLYRFCPAAQESWAVFVVVPPLWPAAIVFTIMVAVTATIAGAIVVIIRAIGGTVDTLLPGARRLRLWLIDRANSHRRVKNANLPKAQVVKK